MPKQGARPPVIVITGGSSGIGKAIAIKYASSRECKLVLAARSKEPLKEVALECRKYIQDVAVIPTDVSKEQDCKFLIEETVRLFQHIDILVLNAGVSMHMPFEELKDLSIFHRLMQINYFGYVQCTFYALPYLRRSNLSPRIVVVSSLSGETGVPLRSGYCASKFAVNGFFSALRMELDKRVGVTVVSPGYVETNIRQNSFGPKEFAPDSKMMSAERCAELIVDAADQGKTKVVLTISGKLAVALRPFFPELVDSVVKKKAYSKQHKSAL
ncbi:Short-chain dehydrogenase/reductase family protein, variant 2 [Balamuthia mandrillaris]